MPLSAPSSARKEQRRGYSGKKKHHTQKAQVVADPKTKRVVATIFSEGKKHDFKLFQESCLPLALEQKEANRQLSREQFVIEHIIRSLKIFRTLAERYRNCRKRFGLRFNLIAALYNYELAL